MARPTDVRTKAAGMYFLPLPAGEKARPGPVAPDAVLARAFVEIQTDDGRSAIGWGETELNPQLVWKSKESFSECLGHLQKLSLEVCELWSSLRSRGHPLEITYDFLTTALGGILNGFNARHRRAREPIPWSAALLCCASLDIATHDAFAKLHSSLALDTLNSKFLNDDLSRYFGADTPECHFRDKYPNDFLSRACLAKVDRWFTLDDPALWQGSLADQEFDSQLARIKVRAASGPVAGLIFQSYELNSPENWQPISRVGRLAIEAGINWLGIEICNSNFNGRLIADLLDELREREPLVYGRITFLSAPVSIENAVLNSARFISQRKPLFLSGQCLDWTVVRQARPLGWTGLVLSLNQTLTVSLLQACWTQAHGMGLLVKNESFSRLAHDASFQLAACLRGNLGLASLIDTTASPDPGCCGFAYSDSEIKINLPAPALQVRR